jgi:hypothetical protein
VNPEDGGTWGYDMCCYERNNGGWDEIRQDWAQTVDELLRIVANLATTPGPASNG